MATIFHLSAAFGGLAIIRILTISEQAIDHQAAPGSEAKPGKRADDDGALWQPSVPLVAGLNEVTVTGGDGDDTPRVLVRPGNAPRRGLPIAPARAIHAIGAWPEHGIEGTQLRPNKNGMRQ